jgi:hypothetical protein
LRNASEIPFYMVKLTIGKNRASGEGSVITLDDPDSAGTMPELRDGDSIIVRELPPGSSAAAYYYTVFDAEGARDGYIYELTGAFAESLAGSTTQIPVEFVFSKGAGRGRGYSGELPIDSGDPVNTIAIYIDKRP